MAGFTIPQPVSIYPNAVVPMPSREQAEPKEGRFYAPMELNWTTGGVCQFIDLGSLITQHLFSQICMIDTDNSSSTVDVELFFPDTQMKITVPAGAFDRCPAPTAGVRFYAAAVQPPNSGDVTKLNVLNYFSIPHEMPATEVALSAIATGVALTASSNAQTLIAAGINGILNTVDIAQYTVAAGATAASAIILLHDGNGTELCRTAISAPSNTTIPGGPIFSQQLGLRFTNGIVIQVIASATPLTNGSGIVSATYRTPK